MIFAAILAGGIGTRLDAGLPKQFYKINNKMMAMAPKSPSSSQIIENIMSLWASGT